MASQKAAARDEPVAPNAGHFVWAAQGTFRGGGLLSDLDMHGPHAGQRPQRPFALGLDLHRRFGIVRRELHRHADRAVVGGDLLDQAERNDVPGISRKLHRLQRVFNVVFCEHGKNTFAQAARKRKPLHGRLAQTGGAWKDKGLILRIIPAQSQNGSDDGKQSNDRRGSVSRKV